jgi:hypothetical protein
MQVVGPTFSAASRSTQQQAFASVEDYFRRVHEDELPQCLRMRVVVTDGWTGRQALLWDSGNEHSLHVGAPNAYWQGFLPPDSLWVVSPEFMPLVCCCGFPAPAGGPLRAGVGFHVRPEEGQEGVAPEQRLYRLAVTDQVNYEEHDSLVTIFFDSNQKVEVGRLVRSLLCAEEYPRCGRP